MAAALLRQLSPLYFSSARFFGFASDIRHVSGKDNPVADALPQIEINATMDECHQSILQSWLLHNRTTVSFRCCDSKRTSSSSKISNFQASRFPSFATSLPVVIARAFQHHFAAETSTPCIPCSTPVYGRLSASSQGNIYGLEWTSTPPAEHPACLKCQITKAQRNTVCPLGTFTPPDSRFSHVLLDLSQSPANSSPCGISRYGVPKTMTKD
ncbi:hypothetical protein MRX96_031164 [Rhipicephalus microplus]